MKLLADNFSKAYPGVAPEEFKNACIITEPANKGTDKFQQIELTGFDGFSFPHDLAAKASSFPTLAKHDGILSFDCDGIILFEKDGQKYILYAELKSSFVKDEIVHAKDQIVGSYVKMKGLLSTLQGYDINDFKYIGVIVSFSPTQEQLTAISKNEDRGSSFAIILNNKKKYHMPALKCNNYFSPLAVGDFDIYHIGVPERKTEYSFDINTFFQDLDN